MILIVDDESSMSDFISQLVSPRFEPVIAKNAEEGILKVKELSKKLCLIISDYKMDGMNGMDFRRALIKEYVEIPFVLMSGFLSKEQALAAIDAKISTFIAKPFDDLESVTKILFKYASERESQLIEKDALEKIFIEEAGEIVEELEPLIMSLEQSPNDLDVINTIFRLVHTIKGSSGVLDSTFIRNYVHKYEDLLSSIKSGNTKVTPEIISVLLSGLDVVSQMMAHLKAGEAWTQDVQELAKIFDVSKVSTEHSPATKLNGVAAPKTPVAKETVNVPSAMLDEFMELSGEITVIRNMVNKLVKVIEKESPGNKNVQHLGELLDEMHKINSSMQGRMDETRKVPLSKVFKPLPRTVRDTARSLGKNINLTIEGEDIRVDTVLANVLSESLIHLVRNSIDHGIEDAAVRASSAKAPEGSILVKALETKDEITVIIKDDGGGLDVEKIRNKAKEKGVLTAKEADELTKQQVFGLIFESGFSTAAKVTDVSGRGVGMDMVKSSVQKIKGRIEIESEQKKGTQFTLKLPVPKSVLIISSLLVESGDCIFAIPQESISRLVRLEDKKINQYIKHLEGTDVFQFDNHIIPLLDLRETLGFKKKGAAENRDKTSFDIVIVKTDHAQFAISVDRILDGEEIVVKPVGKYLEKLKIYMGATFMGDGTIGLILSVEGISQVSNLETVKRQVDQQKAEQALGVNRDLQDYLTFSIGSPGIYGIPLSSVYRLEEMPYSAVQKLGQRDVLIYREQTAPVVNLSKILYPDKIEQSEKSSDTLSTFMVCIENRYFAFEILKILDVTLAPIEIDQTLARKPMISGCITVADEVVTIVDVPEILRSIGLLKKVEPSKELEKYHFGPVSPEKLEVPVESKPSSDSTAPAEANKTESFAGDGWGIF